MLTLVREMQGSGARKSYNLYIYIDLGFIDGYMIHTAVASLLFLSNVTWLFANKDAMNLILLESKRLFHVKSR